MTTPHPSGRLRRFFFHWAPLLWLACFTAPVPLLAQTQQPFLLANTQVNGTNAVAVFTRDDANGTLTEVANSPFVLTTPNCSPSAIDPKARYLFGACGDGVSLYSFNGSSGAAAEVANSPFAVSTGGIPDAVIAEATGQYVYAIRISRTTFPTPSTATLDTFQIDTTNNVLAPVPSQPSQTFTLAGSFLNVITDPNHHFIQIFLEVPDGTFPPMAGNCGIFFDSQSGLPKPGSSGICTTTGVNGSNFPTGISINGKGTLIGTGAEGQYTSSFSVTQISPVDGSQVAYGAFVFDAAYEHPAAPLFDPTGQIAYVSTMSSPLRIFAVQSLQGGTVQITELASSPLPASIDPAPISGVANPVSDFSYVGGSNSISAYPIDTSTGYPRVPVISNFSHTPALTFQPTLATLPPAGQAVSAPAASVTPNSLVFGPTTTGQVSASQTITVSSTGNQALTISSIALNPGAGVFSESDTCMAHPVLAPGTFCTISAIYSPTLAGTDQASLTLTDNAAGSPQNVALSGTAVAPPPPAPAVTLIPGTLNFPGTTTQGTSSASQPINITNSGNAALTISSGGITLNGVNTNDFAINSNTCPASLAANASCVVNIIFSPLAAGVRTTSLMIANNAANSPQSVTINGTAAAAAVIAPPSGGATSASVSAGQMAQYNLQATPGTGFNGALTFTCNGAPTGATCSVPQSLSVSDGAATPFTVSVSTSGSAAFLPPGPRNVPARWRPEFFILALLAILLFLAAMKKQQSTLRPAFGWQIGFASTAILLALAGCGGGGSSTTTPPPVITPAGTYTIVVTPSATATGSTKALALAPIQLSLTVK